jgi:magnesium chelatase family protein
MTLARTCSVTLLGVVGHLVEVEADLAQGLPALTLVGLPDAALSEARDRIRAAVVNSGAAWPQRRITLNLSPASLPKAGSGFDLALAVCVLAAAEVVEAAWVRELVLIGELGLDGRARPVRGILPAVMAAAAAGRERVVVPAANAAEAALVPGVRVVGVESLRELIAILRGDVPVPDLPDGPAAGDGAADRAGVAGIPDLADVAGQGEARHALEIAAAGGHHMLLHGPPGTGKTMLAERLPGILPPLDREQALEVTAIHSVAGELGHLPLVTRPPLRAPHHTASAAAVVGGGSGLARPGAASLAHHGVLLLDEAPEFALGVLDALRQPLESGEVVLHRSKGEVRYPASFQLVLAANPCPCGLSTTSAQCRCPPMRQLRYIGRLSGPLLDRVDLTVPVLPPTRADLMEAGEHEGSAAVADRVRAARERATARWTGTPWSCNARVPGPALRGPGWRLPGRDLAGLHRAFGEGRLTARGVDRVLRLAWTLADLAGKDRPQASEVRMAVELRTASALPGAAA